MLGANLLQTENEKRETSLTPSSNPFSCGLLLPNIISSFLFFSFRFSFLVADSFLGHETPMVQPSLAPEEDTTNSTRSTTLPDQVSIPTVENESRRDRQIAIPPLQLSVLQGLEGTTHQFTHSPTSIQPSPTASAPTVSPSTNDLPGASEKQGVSQPPAPLRSRPVASQTFAEGMNGSLQALRRKTFDRLHHRRDTR